MAIQREGGAPFRNSAEWNWFLQAVFKEHTDAEIGCNALQYSFVTHVMESEWGRIEEEMDKLVRSMCHSRREQRQTYMCDR